LTIVIAVAIAVTSIPVISKIFIDLGIINTRFAKIVLATATIEDAVLWVALAIATGLAGGQVASGFGIASKMLVTIGFFGMALLVLPNLLDRVNRSAFNLIIKSSATGYVLFICFLLASVASVLSVNIIFGAFLAGIIVGMSSDSKIGKVKIHVKEIALGLFVPFYFAVVGLKLNFSQHFDVLFFLMFMLIAVAVKTLGTVLAARLARQDWLSSVNLGVAMNARGGPGIVLATVAFDLGIINQAFFVVLVSLAIVTSALAGWWFRLILAKGWELMSNPRPHAGDPSGSHSLEPAEGVQKSGSAFDPGQVGPAGPRVAEPSPARAPAAHL
jgi:Kef-type K+ transport system membrane component KefB